MISLNLQLNKLPQLTCEIWESGLAANKCSGSDTGSSLSVTSSLHGGAECWGGAGDGERHYVWYVVVYDACSYLYAEWQSIGIIYIFQRETFD